MSKTNENLALSCKGAKLREGRVFFFPCKRKKNWLRGQRVLDFKSGYAHSIENTRSEDLVLLTVVVEKSV